MAYAAYPDELAFADYLHRVLNRKGFADALGWTVEDGDYDDIVNEALRRYDTDDITSVAAASVYKLNAVGRAELWGQVAEATAHFRTTRAPDGSAANMEQIHKQALVMQAQAEEKAAALGYGDAAYTVGFVSIRYAHDPYAALESDE